MKLEERDGLRVLYPDYGYLLKNTENGNIHAGEIYLADDATIDIYEEIRDWSIDESLFIYLSTMKAKEESLNKIGKLVANQVNDDAVALSISEFYDVWEPNRKYEVGRYLQYKSVLYKTLQTHTSQDTWTPDVTASLYAKVLVDPSGETIKEWEQPDSTNAYMTGDKVYYNGIIYESTIDNNVWSPADYPAGWKTVE